MPLSDELLSQGNPGKPSIGVDPVLGSPSPSTASNPAYPTTSFIESRDKLESMGGPSLEDWVKPGAPSKRPASSTMVGVDEILANKRYKYYEPGADNEEIAGQGQSAWDKWGNALVKMGATALGTFAQGFMTIPDTISAIKEGKISNLYQSNPENAIDNWLKNLEDDLPNYYTQWQKDHPFLSALPFSGGAANFWADKVVKNLGFMAGAMGSAMVQDAAIGLATAGAGDVPLIAAQVGKASLWLNKILTGSDKLGDVLKLGKGLEKSAETLFQVERLGQVAAGIKTGNSLRYGMNLYGAARTEAAIEAREGYNSLKADLVADFTKTHGYQPIEGDLSKIEAYATASANARFGINLALLTVSDAIQFDTLLRPFGSLKKGLTQTGASGIKLVEGSLDTFEKAIPKTVGGKIWNFVKPNVKNIFAEGVYEEGGQYAAQVGSYNYYKDKYDGNIKGSMSDIMNATGEGLAAQFGSVKGLESMFIGGLIGGLMGGVMTKLEGNQDLQTQATLQALNSKGITGILAQQYADTTKSVGIKRDMEKAVSEGNVFEYKNLQHDMFYNFIKSGMNADRFDVRLEQIKMLGELDQKEFEKMFGMEPNASNKKTVKSFIDGLLQKAKDIEDTVNSIDSVFTNPFTRVDNPSTPETIKENSQFSAFEDWKNELAYYGSFLKDSDNRITSIRSQIAEINGGINSNVLQSLTNKKALQGLLGIYNTRVQFAKDEIESNPDPLIKANRKNEVKAFITNIENIKKLLDGTDEVSTIKLASELIEFESARSAAPISIPKEKIPELLTLGKDLNNLEDRKKIASIAYDKLANPEGLDKFMAEKEKLDNLATTTPDTEVPKTITFKNKEGNQEELLVGKKYGTDKTLKYSVVPSKDKFNVVDEEGKVVTTKNTQQAAKEAVDVLDKANKGMGLVTVQGFNPDGTVRVQLSNGEITDVSTDLLSGYNRRISQEEKILEDKELQGKLEKEQEEANKEAGPTITGAPDEPIPDDGSKKKSLRQIASTSDSSSVWDKEGSPERARNWAFLNNYKDFPNKENIRVITVNANTEKELGLEGITDYKMPNATQEEKMNPDTGIIITAYIEQDGNNRYFIDSNGKRIGRVGEKQDINKIVYTTLTDTSLTNSKGVAKFREKETKEGTAADYQRAWKETRTNLLGLTSGYHISDFIISRGIAEENVVDGKKESNSVVGTLIDEKDLRRPDLIIIPTQGTIEHNGNSVGFPNGRPVLHKDDTLQFLNNRNLSEREVETVFELLKQLAAKSIQTGKFDRQILSYLQGIVYFGYQEGKPGARNQVWVKKGKLHLGNTNADITFTPDSIEAAKDAVIEFLKGAYNNVNKNKLKDISLPFEEILGVYKDGTLNTVTWKSYQSYLLSDKFDLVKEDTSIINGESRLDEEIPLTTTVRKRVDKTDYNYVQKYVTLTDVDLKIQDTRKKEAPKPPIINAPTGNAPTQNTTTGDSAVVKAGSIVFDGVTVNIFPTSKGKKVSYLAKVEDEGRVIVSLVKDAEYAGAVVDVEPTASETLGKFGIDASKIPQPELANTLLTYVITMKAKAALQAAQEPTGNPEAQPKKPEVPDSGTVQGTPTVEQLKQQVANQAPKQGGGRVSNFRIAFGNIHNVEKENWDKSEPWLKENLPQVPLHRLNTLIKQTGGGYAWGVFKDGAIYIYENAEIGTTYHEAFEAVWGMFTTSSERSTLVKEFRDRQGEFIDRPSGATIKYSNATESQIREQLAEEFRDYNLEGKIPPSREKKSGILNFFKELLTTIKNFILNRASVEKTFKRLNTGYYKTRPINVRNINLANENYRSIAGFNEQVSHEIIQVVASKFIQQVFEGGNSLVEIEESSKKVNPKLIYDKIYESLMEEYEYWVPRDAIDEIAANPEREVSILANVAYLQSVWNDIKSNWNEIINQNDEYLRTFGIVNEQTTEGESNVEENLNNDDRQGRSDDYLKDTMRIDAKKNASTAIKLLFATLIQSKKQDNPLKAPSPLPSSIGQQQLVEFGRTFNHVMHNLVNTNGLSQMVSKIKELSVNHPEYVRLFTRLRGDLSTGTISYDKLTFDDWKLLMKFFNVFNKQKPKAYIQIIGEGDNTRTISANINEEVTTVKESWLNKIRNIAKENSAIVARDTNEKAFVIYASALGEFPKSIKEKVEFLSKLGINFTEEQINNLSGPLRSRWGAAAASIYSVLAKNPKIMTLNGKTLDITGPLDKLAEVSVLANGDFSESTFFNTEGEKVQTFVQNNHPSLFINDFNSVSNITELQLRMPYLFDVWSKDSEILSLGGKFFTPEGERTQTQLTLGYVDGTRTKKGKGIHTSKLSLVDRRIQEINQNLQGQYYVLVPADSKTEWMLSVGNFVSYGEMSNATTWDKIHNKFNDYLATEIQLAQRDQDRNFIKALSADKQGQLRFFKDILSSEDLKKIEPLIKNTSSREEIMTFITDTPSIKASIRSFIEKENSTIRTYLEKYNKIENEGGKYKFAQLDENFRNHFQLGKEFTEAELNNILLSRTINYMVANIEMFKTLFGDPALINDPTKRIKSFLSGTETPYHTEEEFNTWANTNLNEGLELGDAGYHEFSNSMLTVTAKDIRSNGEMYDDINEADAQTWMKDTGYREFMIKHGRWTNKHEVQFQYEMAWTRDYLGQYANANSELAKRDKEILAKGNPHAATFQVIKPKGSGQKDNDNFIDPYLDKTSAAPIFLRFVAGRNLETLYTKMFNNSIDYVIVESGRKIGAEALHPLYNEDGSFNEEDFEENTMISIPFKNMGIQQETASDGKKQTLGSQLTKLVTMDLMEDGVALTPEIDTLIKKNQSILEDMIEDGYQRLLNKLGIVDNGDSFSTPDKEKIAEFLRGELIRREIDSNTLDGVSYNVETGDFNIPLEAHPRYLQLKNILYSVVDKYIGSPKVNGGQKIQMSSSMWESGSRGTRKGNIATSDTLKFYTKEDPYMEVLLPHWFKNELRKKFKGLTDEQLLKQLIDSDVLKGIGFRIPTQALASIEAIRIKGFLPQEMGDTIVVPAELTVKAGSDFDVDKLSTYLKNIEVDKNGKISSVQYKGSREATMKFYGDKFDKSLAERRENAETFLEAMSFGLEGVGDDQAYAKMSKLLEGMQEWDIEEAQKTFDKLNDAGLQDLIRENYVNRKYTQSLENAYFKSLEELITLPENFDRLTKPNTDKTLKGLRDKLVQLTTPKEEQNRRNTKNNHSLLISPSYMSEQRHNFMIGKGGVGIAAIQQTGHSLNQRSSMYIDPAKHAGLTGVDKIFTSYEKGQPDVQIRLPHNTITIDGNTYASLSKIKDKAGKYISDKISEYINGYVDISKDAFIVELGASPNVASIFMFLEKVGVPTENVVMFMNQPIIRDFLTELSIKGWSYVLNTDVVAKVKDKYVGPYTRLTGKEELDVKEFENTISKVYRDGEKLTLEENGKQKQILDEFLKYAVLSNHLTEVMLGTNYDTANFNDPNIYMFKEQKTISARNTLISSSDNLLNNSFIGKKRDVIGRTREAIAQAVPIRTERWNIRKILDPIKRLYGQRGTFMAESERLKVARNIEVSFLDYLIQNKLNPASGKLNTRIEEILVDVENSVSSKLFKLKRSLPEDSDLANNPILRELDPTGSEKFEGARLVKLMHKDNDSYTSNLYTGALRELRDNANTSALYKDLIMLSILQSGIQRTSFSFGHLIPIEDYSKIINPILERLDAYVDLENFRDNFAFQRNSWKSDTAVPSITPRWESMDDGQGGVVSFETEDETIEPQVAKLYKYVPQSIKNLRKEGLNNINFISLSSIYNSGPIKFPVVKVIKDGINPKNGQPYTNSQKAAMIKEGDFSFKDITLYAQVMDSDGNPLMVNGKNGEYKIIYKAINAWGDGQFAQEYYEDGRPSVLNNNTTKVEEIPDSLIVDAYYGRLNPVEQSIQPEVINQEAEPATVPQKPVFKKLTTWKKAGKKEATKRTIREEGKNVIVDTEGYKVTFDGHPSIKAHIVKDDKWWSLIEDGTGVAISDPGSTIKEAIELAIERINKAIENGGNATVLASIGIEQTTKEEALLDRLKKSKIIETDC